MGLTVCREGDIRVKEKRIKNCECYCFVDTQEPQWKIFSLIYWEYRLGSIT